jgi:hypothetical protein
MTWLIVQLALVACGQSHTPAPEVGGETNWLRTCTKSSDCDAGSCLCGLCTTACTSSSACTDPFTGECTTIRTAMGGNACDAKDTVPPAGMCLPGCNGDDECGKGFACRQSSCVSRAIAQRLDAFNPPDADEGMDGGACDCGASEVSLDCVCSLQTCPEYSAATAFTTCPVSGFTTLQVGCGSVLITTGGGFDSRSFLYQGAERTLVGASFGSDAPFGICRQNDYSSGMLDLTQCADYTNCSLCQGETLPQCKL